MRALRLIHIFGAAPGAWFRSLAAQNSFPWTPSWCHGALPGRSREGALLVLQSSAWRAKDCGRSALTVLYDCSNAFACSDHDQMREIADWWFEKDATYVHHMIQWGLSSITTPTGTVSFHPEDGGYMGHVLAPAFVRARLCRAPEDLEHSSRDGFAAALSRSLHEPRD